MLASKFGCLLEIKVKLLKKLGILVVTLKEKTSLCLKLMKKSTIFKINSSKFRNKLKTSKHTMGS